VPGFEVEPRDRTTVLVHYYRAMVGRADIWRTRMDATTNWAIGSTAAVVSFVVGNSSVPHYVMFMAPLMTLSFLLLEARRLTFYHLWQQRVLILERGFIRPVLSSVFDELPETAAADASDLPGTLDAHLGRTVPTMPLSKAIARRLRRIYLYLFAVQGIAWGVKLANHPTPVASVDAWVARAHIGGLPGMAVFGLATAGLVTGLILAGALGGVDRKLESAG